MNDLKVYSFTAWDWDQLVSAHFPKWFHSFTDEALAEYGVMVVHAGVLLEGPKALSILEEALNLFAESKHYTKQLEDILNSVITKITPDLKPHTRVLVRT